MNRIRMRTDLAEEGMSVPAGKSFESYDTLVDVIYLTADDLVDATQGNDPVDTDTHPYCYVKLRDGRCFYMVSADLDFGTVMTKRYKVIAKMTTYLYVYVDAEYAVDAIAIAKEMDGGEFIPFDQGIVAEGDWEILDAHLEVNT